MSAKDDCDQHSEGSINYNLSYLTETILSTDGRNDDSTKDDVTMTDVTSGAETAYASGAPEFTPGF